MRKAKERGRGPSRTIRIAEAVLKILGGLAALRAITEYNSDGSNAMTWLLTTGAVMLYGAGIMAQRKARQVEKVYLSN